MKSKAQKIMATIVELAQARSAILRQIEAIDAKISQEISKLDMLLEVESHAE